MLKKFCQCIGLSSLILVMNYGDMLGGGGDVRMHVPFALKGILFAQLAGILLLGLLLFAIIGTLSRTRLYPRVELFLAIVAPPYLIDRIRDVFPFHIVSEQLIVLAVVWAVIVMILLLRFDKGYRRLLRVGDFLGICLAIFGFCSLVEVLYIARWTPGPREHTAAWATTTQPPRQHPLLVWVIFDELSYDQVYGHRASGLALPNFDALRSQSTVFSDVQPIGDRTVKVLPSLLSGHVVNRYRFTFDNRLEVHDTGEHGFHTLNGGGTVFADAKQDGWRTAAVGWYNPYCTIYAGAIDDCYWTDLDMIEDPMAQNKSFWRNTYTPLKQVAEQIVSPSRASGELCSYDVRQRYKTYIDLKQHTSQLLQTDQADFVFLHLPVPHAPNIWSRTRNDYAHGCGSSYLDGLALADRTLGNVMRILQSSPRWKDTTLIVEGDHSWRTYVWDDQPAWTREDQAASRDHFDPRPAVVIHRAGQTEASVVDSPWSLLNVHAFVEQVVHGEKIPDEAQNLKR